MIAAILVNAGLDPSVIVGGIIPELNGNARAGDGEYFVIEADEYDRAFLGLQPQIAVVTSIEMDHPDIYRNIDEVAQAFHEFVALVPRDGVVIGCGDSPRVVETLRRSVSAVRYGFDAGNDWRATDVQSNDLGGSDFAVQHHQSPITDYQLRIPGTHNVLNALAAIAVAAHLGIDLEIARATLSQFRGAARRFQVKGEWRGVTIIDDYAHHPTEIRATLAAARARYGNRKIWAVFQPHTYSRTETLLDDFAQAFSTADHVIVTEIFAAREKNERGLSSAHLVERMQHADVRFIAELKSCADYLARHVHRGDVLVTLGAGDVNSVGDWLAQK